MGSSGLRLSGKVAVVTGASKGIGAEIAKELARAGAAVVVNYSRSREGAERVVDTIVRAGGNAVAIGADVSNEADVKRLFAETKSTFGGLDVLVNNAGIYEFCALSELTSEFFRRTFDLNVMGLLLCCREAAAIMRDSGSIINIGSVIGRARFPEASVYTASKAAVDGITRSLSAELGARQIRVNSINPGMVETEGTHAGGLTGGEMQKNVVAQTPLGRIGQPRDIAPVAVYLASSESSWMSGETIYISGGMA